MSIDNYQVTKLKNSVHMKTMSQENLCPEQIENNNDDDDNLNTETIPASINVRSRELMDNATSNMSSLMNFLKGNIGTGILAMPYAFAQAGLWLGLVGILILGAIATHCMHMLVNCSHKLCERTSSVALDYPDVVECCLRTGPQRLRSTATIFRKVIYVFITFTQFGFCCVYIVFVAQNIKQPIDYFHTKIDIKVYIAITAALLIPYCFISNLKTLSIFSLLANLLTVCGLVITFQYIVQKLPPIDSVAAFKPLSNLPSFFGTAIYSFEGISLVLPIENKMRTPQDFGGWTGILTLGMVIVVCLYTSIGFYGYLQFGCHVAGSITLNLPSQWLYIMVKLLLAIAIFISFGIQFYVPLNLLKPVIGRIESTKIQKIVNFFIRIGLILFLCILALFVPYLELLITLIGAFASSGLALIFPPLIEIVTYSAEGEKLSWIVFMKDIFIILIGVLGFVTGTYTSIADIIHKVQL